MYASTHNGNAGEVFDSFNLETAPAALNPKLVTQRGRESSPKSPQRNSTKKPSIGPTARPLSAPAPRNTQSRHSPSACISDTAGVANRGYSARRYGHIRSVVKDVVERRITPLEALHGEPVRRQKLWRSGTTATCQSPVAARGNDGQDRGPNSDSKTYLSPADVQCDAQSRAGCESLNGRDTPLRRLPSCERDRAFVKTVSARLPVKKLSQRIAFSSSARKLSEGAYLAVIANSRASAKVPFDFVPQCAKNIPKKSECRPSLAEKPAAVLRQKSDFSRVSTPHMSALSDSGVAKSQSARHSYLSPTCSSKMKTNGSMAGGGGAGCEKNGSALMRSLSSTRGFQASARYLPRAKGKSPLRGKTFSKEAETASVPRSAGAKSGEKKLLKGLQRVLLFESEPPKIFA